MPWLINAAQLDKFRKNQKNVVVLDASWHLNSDHAVARNAYQEYLKEHIIGAKFLDLTSLHDASNPLQNMIERDEQKINLLLSNLGITKEHKLIFYDASDLHTSFRAVWCFKVFGHNPHQLYVLNGGLQAWKNEGGKLEAGEVKTSPKRYLSTFQARYVRTLVQMKTNLHHPTEQVIDMRHAVRYAGGKEHRPGLRSGHIPGSYSFPYMTMFEQNGLLKDVQKIKKQLLSIGVDLKLPIVTTCGSGMTAAILNVALDLMNISNHALYDGGWVEWGGSELYTGEESLSERPVSRSVDVNL